MLFEDAGGRASALLLFVSERFAVRAYLNFRFFPVGFDHGLIGDELILFL